MWTPPAGLIRIWFLLCRCWFETQWIVWIPLLARVALKAATGTIWCLVPEAGICSASLKLCDQTAFDRSYVKLHRADEETRKSFLKSNTFRRLNASETLRCALKPCNMRSSNSQGEKLMACLQHKIKFVKGKFLLVVGSFQFLYDLYLCWVCWRKDTWGMEQPAVSFKVKLRKKNMLREQISIWKLHNSRLETVTHPLYSDVGMRLCVFY